MRTFIAIFTLIASGICAVAAAPASKPVLTFSLTATNNRFTGNVGQGLTLRVERDVLGWEVGIFRKGSTANLLCPQRNWHGAYPCQLSAWSHRTQTLPDERVIPVRGTSREVRVRLVEASVSGKEGSERFTGGRVQIYWGHHETDPSGSRQGGGRISVDNRTSLPRPA